MENAITLQPDSGIKSTALNFWVADTSYFDFETRTQINFVLEAVDTGNTTFFSQTPFTIDLIDENDMTPMFENAPYAVNISEDMRELTTLPSGDFGIGVTVSAYDLDATSALYGNDSLRYELAYSLPIEINATTGEVYFTQKGEGILDFETQPQPVITVSLYTTLMSF